MKRLHQLAILCLPLWLAGCALTPPPAHVQAETPAQWQAPTATPSTTDDSAAAQLPHHGTLADLSLWWQRQNDALLVQLIDAAQVVSPDVASARARIEQSRANAVAAGAALLPTLDLGVSVQRSNIQRPLPLNTTSQAALQPSWEIDVFGANRATRRAAMARYEGAQAGWHDARVAVAAEVANRYYSLRN